MLLKRLDLKIGKCLLGENLVMDNFLGIFNKNKW